LLKESIEDGIAIIKLNNGVTNAINLELVNQLTSKLQEVEKASAIHGIILTSANSKFFSIGLDIPNLFNLPREEFHHFYTRFNDLCLKMFIHPKPILAAITGHAIAGGCILTLPCDYRYISDGRKFMGLNEVKLGVSIPYPALCILENIVGFKNTREIVFLGEFYPPDTLIKKGLVDKICSENDLINDSMVKIKAICQNSLSAFNLIKQESRMSIYKRIKQDLENHNDRFVKSWYQPETRILLEEAIKKF
jgi:enoyl-CoA hydratase/carnithine racemase